MEVSLGSTPRGQLVAYNEAMKCCDPAYYWLPSIMAVYHTQVLFSCIKWAVNFVHFV